MRSYGICLSSPGLFHLAWYSLVPSILSWPEQTLLQGRHTEGWETYERMLSITSHQRDANSNHNKIPPHTDQNGQHKQINKSTNNKCWRGCGRKGTLVHCWWGCRLVQPLWKTVWKFPRRLNMELPLDPAIPLLGLYPKNPETPNSKEPVHPNVHSSTIYNSQVPEAAYMPISKEFS